MKLEWLIGELHKTINRLDSQKVDALAQIAVPPSSRHPEITRAKLEMRYQTLAEISEQMKWLTGNRRPWMKRHNVQVILRLTEGAL